MYIGTSCMDFQANCLLEILFNREKRTGCDHKVHGAGQRLKPRDQVFLITLDTLIQSIDVGCPDFGLESLPELVVYGTGALDFIVLIESINVIS